MSELTRPAFSPAVVYRDPKAALVWLQKAFGFETSLVVEAENGSIVHSEMRFGDGLLMVAGPYDERHASPADFSGRNTQSIHVQLSKDIDAHLERAKAQGARIVREIADQPYGDRVYAALDPEGHVWSFGQTIAAMSLEEQAKATGSSIRESL
ncbi:MAG: VOC family protein [Caulobacteraceae bacterium]